MTPEELHQAAIDKINAKTKPLGSLGRLEQIAIRLACLQGTLEPVVSQKRILVFAANHGIAREGVSPFPIEVTEQMVLNFLKGGAGINVLARNGDVGLHIIDVGVGVEWPEDSKTDRRFFIEPVAPGTRNFLQEPAMTQEQCEQALESGRRQARLAREQGIHAIGLGEMGIGNTTSASALFVTVMGIDPDDAVGRGAGASPDVIRRKAKAIRTALDQYGAEAQALPDDKARAMYWLRTVGGFEIAGMAGAILEAARLKLPVVVDGFISTAAAAVAITAEPSAREACFFSHKSNEKAHAQVMKQIGEEPLLDLGLRLGEGTGAALVLPILEASARVMTEMSSFEDAGVTREVAS